MSLGSKVASIAKNVTYGAIACAVGYELGKFLNAVFEEEKAQGAALQACSQKIKDVDSKTMNIMHACKNVLSILQRQEKKETDGATIGLDDLEEAQKDMHTAIAEVRGLCGQNCEQMASISAALVSLSKQMEASDRAQTQRYDSLVADTTQHLGLYTDLHAQVSALEKKVAAATAKAATAEAVASLQADLAKLAQFTTVMGKTLAESDKTLDKLHARAVAADAKKSSSFFSSNSK